MYNATAIESATLRYMANTHHILGVRMYKQRVFRAALFYTTSHCNKYGGSIIQTLGNFVF